MRRLQITRFAFAVLGALLVSVALLLPAAAYAAEPTAPTFTPYPIVLEGFESATSDNYVISAWDGPAWWGRLSKAQSDNGGSYRSGLWGLWCSATGGTWATYRLGSAGFATFALPESGDYHTVYADFWYRMPTVGAYDASSFQVGWWTDALSSYPKLVSGFSLTSGWSHVVLDMSAPVEPDSHDRGGNLSRQAGSVVLKWSDVAEPSTVTPKAGQGPSVDDVAITGWKFGAVRDATATATPGQVTLSWKRPLASTDTTSLEDREIGYRVFRKPQGGPTWTRITPSLLMDAGSIVTFADTSVVPATAYTYAIQTYDAVGGYGIPVTADVVSYDTLPPSTSAYGIPAGWSTTNVTVSLAATDQPAGSGVSATYYAIGPGTQQLYGGPFVVSNAGTTTVEYWSVDRAGNAETPHETATVRIDKTAPTTSAFGIPGGWSTSDVEVTFTADDGVLGSGVSSTLYRLNGGAPQVYTFPFAISAEGTTTIEYWSTDVAGNAETPHQTATARVDRVAPSTTISGVPAGWSSTTATLALTAADGATGSGIAATYYRLNGAGQQVYSAPLPVTAEGTTTVEYWSVDSAGNAETPHKTAMVRIDKTAPSTNASGVPIGWSATDVAVTLVPTDPAPSSGMTTYYRIGAGAPQFYTSPFAVTSEGTTTVEYWSADLAGNEELPHKTATVKIDGIAPITSLSAIPMESGYAVALVAADAAPSSGILQTLYRVNTGPVQSYSSTFTVSSEGTHTIEYWSVDAAGNEDSPHKETTLRISKIAPSTSIQGVPEGWSRSSVTAILTAYDATGVRATFYRLGGSIVQTYTAPIVASAEGTTTLDFWSEDIDGNVEATKTASIRIDTAAPTTSRSDLPGGWSTTDVTVTLTPYDPAPSSGGPLTRYRLNSGVLQDYSGPVLVTTEGTNTIEYWSVDAAGNEELPHMSATIRIDKTAPSTGVSGVPEGWSKTNANVTLTPIDVAPGSGGVVTYYRLNSGLQQVYAGSVPVSNEGTNTLEFWSTDAAGNEELPHRTTTVRIDSRAPATSATGVPEGWSKTNASITLAALDPVPGSAGVTIRYRLNSGLQQTYVGPVPITADGTNTLEYWSVDAAGNEELPHKTATIRIDKVAPSTSVSGVPAGWSDAPVTVTLAPTDPSPSSGGVATRYRLNSGAEQTYTGSIPVTAQGTTGIEYWSVDAAGNEELPHKTATVMIDTVEPFTSISAVPTGWTNTNVPVVLGPTDPSPSSGSVATFYRLDSGLPLTYSGPLLISGEGTTTIDYWSVDGAGNVESPRHTQVRVDKTAPVVTSDAKSRYMVSAVVNLEARDSLPSGLAGSGVAEVRYRFTSGGGTGWMTGSQVSTTAVGTHRLEAVGSDFAGNQGAPVAWTFEVVAHPDMVPIDGATRILTAIEASQEAFGNGEAPNVVIATAFNWPDALGGSALAGVLRAPILLTAPNTLSAGVADEIKRLGATKVYILGGEPAVSKYVLQQIEALQGVVVERIGGTNRYDTASKVAAKAIELQGTNYDGNAFVATGLNFPDALGASPLAAANGWPIYLANPAWGSNETIVSTMDAAGVKKAILLGGPNVVSADIADEIDLQLGPIPQRLYGSDRYSTAIAVASHGVATGLSWDKLAIATGQNFPDALAGGVLQGRSASVMLLTPSTSLYSGAASVLSAHKADIFEVRFLGGLPALSQKVRDQVEDALSW